MSVRELTRHLDILEKRGIPHEVITLSAEKLMEGVAAKFEVNDNFDSMDIFPHPRGDEYGGIIVMQAGITTDLEIY